MIHTFSNYGTFYCTDDDEEVDETEDETLSFTESLKMLDKIDKCYFLDEESHKMCTCLLVN